MWETSLVQWGSLLAEVLEGEKALRMEKALVLG